MKVSVQSALPWIITAVVSVLVVLIALTPIYEEMEFAGYDTLLHLRPNIEMDESILFVDIDDASLDLVGPFPWSRNILADGLLLLREYGVENVMFDIEFINESPEAIDNGYLEGEFPTVVQDEIINIISKYDQLLFNILRGDVSFNQLETEVDFIYNESLISEEIVMEAIDKTTIDADLVLGTLAAVNGGTIFTIGVREEDLDLTDEQAAFKQRVKERFAIADRITEPFHPIEVFSLEPTIEPIIFNGAGAGFPDVVIDSDGVRRRIKAVVGFEDAYISQLALAMMVDYLGNPQVEVTPTEVNFQRAQFPDGSVKDFTIPLNEEGSMLINWPSTSFDDSFRHLSFIRLFNHREQEKRLFTNIINLDKSGFFFRVDEAFDIVSAILDTEAIREEFSRTGDASSLDIYIANRNYVFDNLDKLIQPEFLEQYKADVDFVVNDEQISEEEKNFALREFEKITEFYTKSESLLQDLLVNREILKKEVPNSLALIGWVGTSTTDRGVTPFDGEFDNVGTHAAVANMVLQQEFLDEIPWIISLIGGIGLAFLMTLILRNLSPGTSIVVGFSFLIVIFLTSWLAMLLGGLFIPFILPLVSVGLSFLGITFVKLLRSNQDRLFIQNAFNRYLSPDVIKDLINDKEKLQLGGHEEQLTAIFTDVEGFSRISEELGNPEKLVNLLNIYLTNMSDNILDNKGTIDKYEGDAIMAFFGAPIHHAEHANLACKSALDMKRKEDEINPHLIADKVSPKPLRTRMGINTGPMVVGNMGTERKMDYTVMGAAVNLASRLEGVNKQYGTYILVSEDTVKEAGDDFVFRQLDRVRPVGMDSAVRLYELQKFKSELTDNDREFLEIFHEALTNFEAKEWTKAAKLFSTGLRLKQEDGPSEMFKRRCEEYQKNPPSANWDGVFALKSK
jgi:adenylate cyclase